MADDPTTDAPQTPQQRLASVEATIRDIEQNGQQNRTRDGRENVMPDIRALYAERKSLLDQLAASTPLVLPGYRPRRLFVRGRGTGLS